jgi:hypothetical protein
MSWSGNLRLIIPFGESAGGPMEKLVAFPTKRDQVGLRIVSKGASPFHMVNVQIPERATLLALPTVAFQD